VKLLLDTHILLWAKAVPDRLPDAARALLTDLDNDLVFSVASLWEVAIKSGLQRGHFHVDARLMRRRLVEDGYEELAVNGGHAVAVAGLPPIHKDPFDRLLVAQAMVEGITLLTADPFVARYPCPVRLV
jgi:PIN domain nuclease of toxin-antitoxin system